MRSGGAGRGLPARPACRRRAPGSTRRAVWPYRCGVLGALLAVASLAGAGCREPQPTVSVILVSVDTLRADHLGAYGHEAATSPAIDAFRARAVLFSEAMAHAPSTLPSHASMLTSLLPHHHGASFARGRPLAAEALTLAEVLGEHGYRSAAFTGGGQLDPALGVYQGFDTVETFPRKHQFADAVERAAEWIAAGSGPFFLFLHTYDVHHPYDPERWRLRLFEKRYRGPLPRRIGIPLLTAINAGRMAITEADRKHIEHAYDAEIHRADEVFGRLVERLEELGVYDDALVILTSDHGEEFGEHGVVGWHGDTLYDEMLRVPLVVKLPGFAHAGQTVHGQVRGIDLAPTVLDVVGADIPRSFTGKALTKLIAGGLAADLPVVSAVDVEVASERDWAIRVAGWKLYGPRLFDLSNDPAEKRDVASAREDVARSLARRRSSLVEARRALSSEGIELTPAMLEQLRELGYIDPAAGE